MNSGTAVMSAALFRSWEGVLNLSEFGRSGASEFLVCGVLFVEFCCIRYL